MNIVMEQTDVCVNEPYAISVDAPIGTIVTWKCLEAPEGVLEEDVQFTIQGNRFTDVILPLWKGCYLITARIKTPK